MSELQTVLVNELANDLVRAIEAMTSEKPSVEMRGTARPGTDWITWRQEFSGSEGAAWLSAQAGTWTTLGARTLRAAGIEDDDPAMAKSTFAEILSQAFSMLALAISDRAGKEWTCKDGAEANGAIPADGWSAFEVGFADGNPQTLLATFDESVLTAVVSVPESSVPALKEASSPATTVKSPVPASKTMDLLLDVELPVSVSFGRAQLPLKDVIKLTTGSIVELNRTIIEPVEVIVNNCVIARGEVVVVEGNFGVRIQQVVSREERLRTLF
jgi:flagellar motor switch protein FliN/FliY